MKKVISLMLALTLIVSIFSTSVSANSLRPDPSITVYLYGQELNFEIDPIQANDTTFVQFTTIFKALDLNYTWDGDTKTIHGYNDSIDMYLTLNDRYVILNDNVVELKNAPFSYEGRTLVPLRFVSEATGLNVDWNGKVREINIYGEGAPPQKPAPTEANIDVLTNATYEGDSPSIVKALTYHDKAPKSFGDSESLELVYENYELFGYNTNLLYNFYYDSLQSISYTFGYTGEALEDDTLITTYTDIVEQISSLIGDYSNEAIYDNNNYVYGNPTLVDLDEPYQSIVYGISNGDYAIETLWELEEYHMLLYTYKEIDGTNRIELAISFY